MQGDIKKILAIMEGVKAKRKSKLDSLREVIRTEIIGNCSREFSGELDNSLSSLWGMGDYITLNMDLREELLELIKKIEDYIDSSRRPKKEKSIEAKKPFNVLVYAKPGSGKSYLVSCLAKALSRYGTPAKEVILNMSGLQIQIVEQMSAALDEVRDIKVNDEFPILFLDEFDAHPDNYSLLLPLLWDATISLGHRKFSIGNAVIILAGSSNELKNEFGLKPEDAETVDSSRLNGNSKFLDLLSRVPERIISLSEENDYKEKIDKVCIAISLIEKRFNDVKKIPWRFLHFIANCPFRYGTRSIKTIIDLIGQNTSDTLSLAEIDEVFADETKFHKSAFKYQIEIKKEFNPLDKWNEIREDKRQVSIKGKHKIENGEKIKKVKLIKLIEELISNKVEKVELIKLIEALMSNNKPQLEEDNLLKKEVSEKFRMPEYGSLFKDEADFYEVLYQYKSFA